MSVRSTSSFDLRVEPWIQARPLSGGLVELSLLDVFRQAHRMSDLVGDVPTQSFALIRLLLAVMHRALQPGVARPMQDWAELWAMSELPFDALAAYLDRFPAEFDLLHPERPFLQVRSLRTAKGEVSGLERLIADVPNGARLFTTRTDAGIDRMPLAEAARWLVHCQAFDPSGIKSGAIGDARVKGGKGYPIGTGWAGFLGGVVVEGRDLRETLLLNLVLGGSDNHASALPEGDVAVWERSALTPAVERPDGSPPRGQTDLMTWPSRRIRLACEGDQVVGVVLCNGDRITPQNQFAEPMTAWRRSEAQEKKLRSSTPVYMPRSHDPERAMWRGLAALLPQSAGGQRSSAPEALRAPGVIEWVADLQSTGVLPEDLVIRTRALGMTYGSQNSTVAEIVDDALSFHAVLVAERGRSLALVALEAVERADQAVTALAKLAANLAVAAGGETDGVWAATREQAYFQLDTPFRVWLMALTSEADPIEAAYDWSETLRRVVGAEGQMLVESAGPTAWVGRHNRLDRHVSTPEADAWFHAALAKATPRRPIDKGAIPA